jgi:hypothetical protein
MKKAPETYLAQGSIRRKYGALYEFLRCIQRPFFAIGWRIEQECARIETKHELDKWNQHQ